MHVSGDSKKKIFFVGGNNFFLLGGNNFFSCFGANLTQFISKTIVLTEFIPETFL